MNIVASVVESAVLDEFNVHKSPINPSVRYGELSSKIICLK